MYSLSAEVFKICFILRKHLCEYLIIQIRIMIKNSYFPRLDIYEKHPYSKSTMQLLHNLEVIMKHFSEYVYYKVALLFSCVCFCVCLSM